MLKSLPSFESTKRLYRYETKRLKRRIPTYSDQVLFQVLTKGYAVIPDYWSRKKCHLACEKIDQLISEPMIKVWKDECRADQRIMGVENIDSMLDLMTDPLLYGQLKRLFCVDELTGFCMAARLKYVPDNKGSGQGWHRDVAVNYQFKAILYLSDVNESQGPLQYYKGSGNALAILNLERRHNVSIDRCRFTNSDINYLKKESFSEICAPAGTLIIANTRGIHRGKPIEKGQRYALTSYQWPLSIPKHIEPYVNGL